MSPSAALEIGCHLPVYGPAATRETLVTFSRRMEALGFDSLWVSDHIVIPYEIRSRYPYNATGDFPLPPTTNFLEPLAVMALVAGVTERVKLGTTVLVLPHRHPVLAAKALSTIDHLAPGRVILGAGVGWMREEIELLGAPYERRGAWTDEAIRVMRACWTDERPEFSGEFFRIPPIGFAPRPPHGPIPVWIGGHTPRALRRVAELGDGWHAAFATPAQMADGLTKLRAECARRGRDVGSITLSVRVGLAARKSADEMVSDLKALRDLGVRHVVLETRAHELGDMVAIHERFVSDVWSRVR